MLSWFDGIRLVETGLLLEFVDAYYEDRYVIDELVKAANFDAKGHPLVSPKKFKM